MPSLVPAWSELQPFVPEMVLVAAMAVGLLIPVFGPKKSNLAVGVAAGLGVLGAIIALLATGQFGAAGSGVGGAYLNGLLIMDPFAWFFKITILIFALVIIAMWAFTTRATMGLGDGPEFFTLLLAALVGMCLMGSTRNLLMIFLAVETASLPSYVLAGFRKTQRLGAEAALKYVVFGAATSAAMLYGMSLLYGLTGSLDLGRIAQLIVDSPIENMLSGVARENHILSPAQHVVVVLGLVGLLIGIGFKIAMVPMHFWAPDVFEGTNIDVAAFLSVASKAAGLALLARVLVTVMGPIGVAAQVPWLAVTVLVLGSITCFWGNLAAFAQNNIKRLLAYSSIAHAGYMLLGLAMVINPDRIRGAEALLYYLFAYVFVNGGAFVGAAAIAQRIGSEDIRDYAGLGRRAPILAACMTIFVFSLVGIPLTVGFSAKFKVFMILFEANRTLGYVGVAVLGVNTVLAAFYYFRIIKQMYLTTTDKEPVSEIAPATLLAVLLVVANIGLFLAMGWVDDKARTFAPMYASEKALVANH